MNDGNISPAVFFSSPGYKQVYSTGDSTGIEIHAHDPDGSINEIQLKVNHHLEGLFKKSPVNARIHLNEGDNLVEAVAVDNAGKLSMARIIVRTDTKPLITTAELPDGKTGAMYYKELFARGNMPVKFKISDTIVLPKGLRLEDGKIINGIPEKAGIYPVSVIAEDEDGDISETSFNMIIREIKTDEILITDVHSVSDTLSNMVSKMMEGELPNTEAGTEVYFSDLGEFAGFTYISTSAKQADISSENILNFHVGQDVTVFVAYEKLDNLFTSTIPVWLSNYQKVPGRQIIAQYHYFDVYRKDFPSGIISLPGGESSENNVICNYFVMVTKKDVVKNSVPEITSRHLSPVKTGLEYQERFTALEGEGKLRWTIKSGKLPIGLTLDNEGLLYGTTYEKGVYKFIIQTEDSSQDKDSISVILKIDRKGVGVFELKD